MSNVNEETEESRQETGEITELGKEKEMGKINRELCRAEDVNSTRRVK